jgi:hypothetical protein
MKNKKTTRSVTYEITRDSGTDFMTVDIVATYGSKQTDELLSDEMETRPKKTGCPYKKRSRKG